MVERCVCCGDIIPEGMQVCRACEQGRIYIKNMPVFTDVLAAHKYCLRRGWRSWWMRYIDGHGYICGEIIHDR